MALIMGEVSADSGLGQEERESIVITQPMVSGQHRSENPEGDLLGTPSGLFLSRVDNGESGRDFRVDFEERSRRKTPSRLMHARKVGTRTSARRSGGRRPSPYLVADSAQTGTC